MTQIETRSWSHSPIFPLSNAHFCGQLHVMPDGHAVLYVNDEAGGHDGGFCENPETMSRYAADVLAQFSAQGADDGWELLTDGSYITAITTAEEGPEQDIKGMKAPPQG